MQPHGQHSPYHVWKLTSEVVLLERILGKVEEPDQVEDGRGRDLGAVDKHPARWARIVAEGKWFRPVGAGRAVWLEVD
jgi:hypothetical protein